MTTGDAFILLVEDNEDDAFLTKRTLKQQHVANRVVVIRDGATALDFLFSRGEYENREGPQLPQMVLLDINLPRLSGLEVLRELRANEQTRFLPVIMFTSSKAEQDIVESYSNSANSYVRKPINAQDFSDALQKIGTYWLILNEPPAD